MYNKVVGILYIVYGSKCEVKCYLRNLIIKYYLIVLLAALNFKENCAQYYIALKCECSIRVTQYTLTALIECLNILCYEQRL